MKKTHYLCFSLRFFFQAGFIIFALAFIASWLAVSFDYTHLSNPWLNFVKALCTTSLRLGILYFLIKLFSAYEKGIYFNAKNIKYIQRIGYLILSKELLQSAYNCFMAGYWTGFNIQTIEMSLLALIIIVNSWIMTEAYKLQQEQQLTI
ncbi:MAG: DUF2975 domain-containing protein [Gammaproteobacteria bacterium]|nr:DUF2975 domain-containing protein [Gammaproteobacteria bacterium]